MEAKNGEEILSISEVQLHEVRDMPEQHQRYLAIWSSNATLDQ
jgi:hypothetical protein